MNKNCSLAWFAPLAASLVMAVGLGSSAHGQAVLPATSKQAGIEFSYFPDRVHAVVFRNWGLVAPERLAKCLDTNADNIRAVATSMGLPANMDVSPEFRRRGYITVLRRNWHLLPYEQLLTVLDMNAEELAFRLREDDFLWLKFGSRKPRCEPLRYTPPNAAAQLRAAEIKQLVDRQFGDRLKQPGKARFEFVGPLSQVSAQPAAERPGAASSAAHAEPRLRFIYSYFGAYGDPLLESELDPYPDGLLEKLSGLGVNGVWLHILLRQLAPGGEAFPEFGQDHERRLASLKHLVERAGRYGIRVYLYMNEPRSMPESFFKNRPEMAGAPEEGFRAMCMSSPVVRRWLRDSLTYVFREVPDLGGVFTISASENLTNCASHGGKKHCPHCSKRPGEDLIKEVNATIAEGVHRGNPKAKFLVWDWQWDEVAAVDIPNVIAGLPKSSWLMSVSEWNLTPVRGGVKTRVGEYSISAVGPGPRATRHWQLAKAAGLKTVAKVQLNNTWELSSVPYLPVLDLVAEHCSRLAKIDTDGMMLSWTLGGYPSLNLEVAKRFDENPSADPDAVLKQLAVDTFGEEAGPFVREAWKKMSRAFEEFPYSMPVLYNAPQTYGPSNPLYLHRTNYKATMLGFPYDDLWNWCHPFSPAVFADQMDKVAHSWAGGIASLEEAIPLVNQSQRPALHDLMRVSRAAQMHFAGAANQARYVIARDTLAESRGTADKQAQLRKEMVRLAQAESQIADELYDITQQDSRIGFEASNHYYYVPLDLVEKVISCDYVRTQLGDGK